MIRTKTEVRMLLARLDDEYETPADMDLEVEAIYETLLWFVGDRTDADVLAYLVE
jgi:hypothetical protein